MTHQRIKAIQSLVPSTTFADGVPQFPEGVQAPSESAIAAEILRLDKVECIKALNTERDRRVDALVGATRSKLLTIAVNVDLLVKAALGDDLTMRDRETLAAGRADLAEVVTVYQKAAALQQRIQAGEAMEDVTADEHWK